MAVADRQVSQYHSGHRRQWMHDTAIEHSHLRPHPESIPQYVADDVLIGGESLANSRAGWGLLWGCLVSRASRRLPFTLTGPQGSAGPLGSFSTSQGHAMPFHICGHAIGVLIWRKPTSRWPWPPPAKVAECNNLLSWAPAIWTALVIPPATVASPPATACL